MGVGDRPSYSRSDIVASREFVLGTWARADTMKSSFEDDSHLNVDERETTETSTRISTKSSSRLSSSTSSMTPSATSASSCHADSVTSVQMDAGTSGDIAGGTSLLEKRRKRRCRPRLFMRGERDCSCSFSFPRIGHLFQSTRRLFSSADVNSTAEDSTTSHCAEACKRGLQKLDLSSKDLRKLPCDIHLCKAFKVLNVSRNHICNWMGISRMRHLKELRAGHNALEDVPLEWREPSLPMLTKLDMSGNNFKAFPNMYWRNIRYVDLSNNQVEHIPPGALETGTTLRSINVKANRLTFLPPLGRLRHLEELCVCDNKLRTLCCYTVCVEEKEDGDSAPVDSKNGSNDDETNSEARLGPSKATLREDETSWSRLVHLKKIDASCNKLVRIPKQLAHACALTHIDLSHNELTTLPESLGSLRFLVDLRLCQNNIASLPSALFRERSRLEILHLGHNRLSELPSCVKHLTQLRELRATNNKIKIVPNELSHAIRLERLDLSYNRITSLFASVGHLRSLERLAVDHNDLDRLPGSLSRCLNLRELLVCANPRLKMILPRFDKLTRLERIDAACCAIERVDGTIGSLRQLQVCRLNGNRISELPSSMGKLSGLHMLDVCDNPIVDVPTELLRMIRRSTCVSETALPLAQFVSKGVLLGGMPAARNKVFLDSVGVTHVINLAGSGGEKNRDGVREIDANRLFPDDYVYLDVDVADCREASLKSHFETCNTFIDDAVQSNGVVLVHCWRGVSRSAAICIAYLMSTQGMTFEDARTVVKSKRQCVRCNTGFVKQLREYAVRLAMKRAKKKA